MIIIMNVIYSIITQGDVPVLFDSSSILKTPKLTLSCSELLCTLGLHILSLPRSYSVLRTRGRGIDRQAGGQLSQLLHTLVHLINSLASMARSRHLHGGPRIFVSVICECSACYKA